MFWTVNTPFKQNWSKRFDMPRLNFWYPDELECGDVAGEMDFFCFRSEIPSLGKFGPKSCLFKLKFDIKDWFKYVELDKDVYFLLF